MDIDIQKLPTPCYIVDERLLKRNLEILDSVQKRTGAKILLALKGFSMHATFPLIGQYLAGVTSSSLFEATLGREKMNKEVHAYVPAYLPSEFQGYLEKCDHLVFNSFDQWKQYRGQVAAYNKHVSCGLRVNPEYSEIEVPLYNPCYENSRLGITVDNFDPTLLDGIEGLHFHTLCEQNSDALKRTIPHLEAKFGPYMKQMKWINFGGGHHITRDDYDIETLVETILYIKEKYEVEVYLEPGEAIALNTGFLVTEVLDIVKNGMSIALIDASAACHMPDVIEMPYRPHIIGSEKPGVLPYTYRLGGVTCLSGDIVGDYSFEAPLKTGDRLVFTDMAHYTMVKNNMFNGVNLPAIALYSESKGIQIIRTFGYDDYKNRLS
jgi:carboxynorspermidine decarboxylase